MKPAEVDRQNVPESNGDVVALRSRGTLAVVMDVELLARGAPDETSRLASCLSDRKQTTIVYTSETRNLDGVRVSERVLQLPQADVVISDAGASVHTRSENPAIADLDSSLASKWIGANVLRKRLRNVCHLVGEHSFESTRRYSCFPRRGVAVAEARDAIEKELEGFGLEVTSMSDDQIDISPPGVDTKSTLIGVLAALDIAPSSTVLTGSFVEERLIAESGCWGIVTRETPPKFKAGLVHCPRVHYTVADGPAAILEGLHTLGFV